MFCQQALARQAPSPNGDNLALSKKFLFLLILKEQPKLHCTPAQACKLQPTRLTSVLSNIFQHYKDVGCPGICSQSKT